LSSLRARADAAAQVIVDDLAAVVLEEQDRHHLVRVLRLRPGEAVVACDGAGSWRLCALTGDGALEPTSEEVTEPAPIGAAAVWLPALKGDRAEWAIAKLTESVGPTRRGDDRARAGAVAACRARGCVPVAPHEAARRPRAP
jgi:hypothetical protein